MIWDNYGLEKQDKDIASYQAIAEVMDRVGIHTGTMFRFQQANTGTEEIFYANMQALQYDILYGNKYVYGDTGETIFKVNEEYRLGVKQPVLTSVTKIGETSYWIKGENFTQSCKVLIDGDMVDTIYVNSGALFIKDAFAGEDSTFVVATQSNSSTHKILSKSNTYPEEETELPLDDSNVSDETLDINEKEE